MKPGSFALKSSMALVAVALATMLLCLTWFAPRTMALFLGPGLACGAAGLVLYIAYVVADLRSRRVL